MLLKNCDKHFTKTFLKTEDSKQTSVEICFWNSRNTKVQKLAASY